jgi:hypothetical protein
VKRVYHVRVSRYGPEVDRFIRAFACSQRRQMCAVCVGDTMPTLYVNFNSRRYARVFRAAVVLTAAAYGELATSASVSSSEPAPRPFRPAGGRPA